MNSKLSIVILLLTVCSQLIWGMGTPYQCQFDKDFMTDFCLGCICEASTGCNPNQKCIAGGSLCGPFLISKAFWIDGGRCVKEGDNPNSPRAFENCALDLKCASRIIRSYANRFAKDCNGDQFETCEDYAMIHRNGGWNCGNSLQKTKYWSLFSKCKNTVINNGNNI